MFPPQHRRHRLSSRQARTPSRRRARMPAARRGTADPNGGWFSPLLSLLLLVSWSLAVVDRVYERRYIDVSADVARSDRSSSLALTLATAERVSDPASGSVARSADPLSTGVADAAARSCRRRRSPS